MSPPKASDGRPAGSARCATRPSLRTYLLVTATGADSPLLEEVRNASVGGAAEHDLQDHAGHADEPAGQHQHRVIKQDTDADHDHPQRGESVEPRERRSEEGAQAESQHGTAEHQHAGSAAEQEPETWPRVTFEPADALQQGLLEALLCRGTELAPLPSLGK